jgi:NAD(P)-dependent dehydrogenase (short-subunit alcohol dehydrogenase family)
MDLGLKGKIVAITGGSEGIGRATALRFAMEGATVAILARRAEPLAETAKEIEALGVQVLAVTGDATKDMARFIDETVKRFGRIDALVNNAGGSGQNSFDKVTDEVWRSDVEVKLFAPIEGVRCVVPHMKKQGGGSIIILTMTGAATPAANQLPTVVSRQASVTLAKALSKELAPFNIRVNVACVGKIKTPQQERTAKRMGRTTEEHFAIQAKAIPLGRMGAPEDMANAIAFLCSEPANYITGTCINVDGGVSGVV